MKLREGVNKVIGSKAFFIVFSILASITLWLYVAYIENPDVSVTIKDIPIEYLNEDSVTERDLIITSRLTETLSMTFTGSRNTTMLLSKDNITASVDLSKIDNKGVIQLDYDLHLPFEVNESSLQRTSPSADKIIVVVDNLKEVEVDVIAKFDGSVAEDFQAEKIEVSPQKITVSGPEETVKDIDYLGVRVVRDDVSKTIDEEFTFTANDAQGHEVVSDQLTFSQDMVNVIVPIVMTKNVHLTVDLIYGAGATEANTTYTISPETVKLSGDAETLTPLNERPVGTIDVTSFAKTTTQMFSITIPNDTTNLTGTTIATVTVTVTGLDTRHYAVTNIQTKNNTAGYTAEIVTQSLDVLLRGASETLDDITADNIRVVADLSELGETTGTYTVPAEIIINGTYVDVGEIGEYRVTVLLTKD